MAALLLPVLQRCPGLLLRAPRACVRILHFLGSKKHVAATVIIQAYYRRHLQYQAYLPWRTLSKRRDATFGGDYWWHDYERSSKGYFE